MRSNQSHKESKASGIDFKGDGANPDEIEQVFRIELVSPNGTVIDVTPQRSAIESIPDPERGSLSGI